jgi:hypothetical protein
MSVVILDNVTSDTLSAAFKITDLNSNGLGDTEFSSYLEVFGDIGGGTLELQKKCSDGTFRNMNIESSLINSDIAERANDNECCLFSMNYKDAGEFKLNLTGATSPSLTVAGINIKLV